MAPGSPGAADRERDGGLHRGVGRVIERVLEERRRPRTADRSERGVERAALLVAQRALEPPFDRRHRSLRAERHERHQDGARDARIGVVEEGTEVCPVLVHAALVERLECVAADLRVLVSERSPLGGALQLRRPGDLEHAREVRAVVALDAPRDVRRSGQIARQLPGHVFPRGVGCHDRERREERPVRGASGVLEERHREVARAVVVEPGHDGHQHALFGNPAAGDREDLGPGTPRLFEHRDGLPEMTGLGVLRTRVGEVRVEARPVLLVRSLAGCCDRAHGPRRDLVRRLHHGGERLLALLPLHAEVAALRSHVGLRQRRVVDLDDPLGIDPRQTGQRIGRLERQATRPAVRFRPDADLVHDPSHRLHPLLVVGHAVEDGELVDVEAAHVLEIALPEAGREALVLDQLAGDRLVPEPHELVDLRFEDALLERDLLDPFEEQLVRDRLVLPVGAEDGFPVPLDREGAEVELQSRVDLEDLGEPFAERLPEPVERRVPLLVGAEPLQDLLELRAHLGDRCPSLRVLVTRGRHRGGLYQPRRFRTPGNVGGLKTRAGASPGGVSRCRRPRRPESSRA